MCVRKDRRLQAVVAGVVLFGSLVSIDNLSAAPADRYRPMSNSQFQQAVTEIQTQLPSVWYQYQPLQAQHPTLQRADTFPDATWWQRFQDPALVAYIEAGLRHSPDLRIAFLRIQSQQSRVRQAQADLYPSVSLSASASRSKNLASSSSSDGEGDDANNGTGGGFFSPNVPQRFYQAPVQARYEVDLWGKYFKHQKAQKILREATVADYQQARLLLSTQIATAYWNAMALEDLRRLQETVLTHARRDLLAETTKLTVGLVDRESVAQKQAQLAQEETMLSQYRKAQDQVRHQLALMVGKTPETFTWQPGATSFETMRLPETMETGFPSGLLRRRPDVLAAELRFRSARYTVAAARRVLYPTIELLAQLGYSGFKIGELFSVNGLLSFLSGSVSQKVFSGGKDWAAYKERKIQSEEALEQYKKAVLVAFQETNDALSQLREDWAAFENNRQVVQATQQQTQLVQYRWQEGAVSGQVVHQSEVGRLKAEQTMLESKRAILIDQISLYKALGGGY